MFTESVCDQVALPELFLLSPQDVVRQVRPLRCVEGLSQDPFFHSLFAVGISVDLIFGFNLHRYVQEFLVQERHAGLHTPRQSRLVGSQQVEVMKVLDSPQTFPFFLKC